MRWKRRLENEYGTQPSRFLGIYMFRVPQPDKEFRSLPQVSRYSSYQKPNWMMFTDVAPCWSKSQFSTTSSQEVPYPTLLSTTIIQKLPKITLNKQLEEVRINLWFVISLCVRYWFPFFVTLPSRSTYIALYLTLVIRFSCRSTSFLRDFCRFLKVLVWRVCWIVGVFGLGVLDTSKLEVIFEMSTSIKRTKQKNSYANFYFSFRVFFCFRFCFWLVILLVYEFPPPTLNVSCIIVGSG